MLNPTQLGTTLAGIFASAPPSTAEAADKIAQAYFDYASQGQFNLSKPVLAGRKDAMARTLTAGLAAPGAPPIAAGAFATSLLAFWLGVPVTGPQNGFTQGCPGAGALPVSLAAVFANLANTHETAGMGAAIALHAATTSVQALLVPPPGGQLVPIR